MDAKSVLFRSGFYSLFRRVAPSRQLAILRYHAVCALDAGYADPNICVTPAAFAEHVAYFASNYSVLPLPDAADAIRRGLSLPRNALAITFDDGYEDNLAAAQVLARHGLSATFYITAGCLAGGEPFWPSELRSLLAGIDGPELAVSAAGIELRMPVATPAEKRAAVAKLTKTFKAHPVPVREALRERLRELSTNAGAAGPMLNWDQVRQMHALGMVIGSHTMTHPNLPNAGLERARAEIVGSKARLEAEIAAPVTMFSYPNGGAERYMTREVASLVREAGFAAATTSRNAFAGPSSDLFALERVQVSQELERLVFALEVERYAFKPKPRPGELAEAAR
jgi:peptidoglycan/xylan/chitin deacetylase (PgdA/CDA1 family)